MYQVQNPATKAMGTLDQAGNTFSKMMPNIPANQRQGPSVGGALMSGVGGASTAMAMGSALGTLGHTAAAGAVGGPVGIGIGAAVGIASYLLS